jgi:hypothetical protein
MFKNKHSNVATLRYNNIITHKIESIADFNLLLRVQEPIASLRNHIWNMKHTITMNIANFIKLLTPADYYCCVRNCCSRQIITKVDTFLQLPTIILIENNKSNMIFNIYTNIITPKQLETTYSHLQQII